MTAHTYTLYELNRQLRSVIESGFASPIWIIAEINSISLHRSGHCYLELVQKSNTDSKIIASARATIWSTMYQKIASYFQYSTGSELKAGINILIRASVDFHELYGFSLNIRDIDPSYTLGDIERQRREILQKLEEENIIDMNKMYKIPYPIKSVAIISSASAAGYEDFIKHIQNNKYGYSYDIELFEANMQGKESENSIVRALDLIFKKTEKFDVVAIIRGGGSKTDLNTFDNYKIAYHITQFPLPVISGIGHERDESVVDIVANLKLKTPTAVAEFIINRSYTFEKELENTMSQIRERYIDYIYLNNLILTQAQLNLSGLRKILNNKKEHCNNKLFSLKSIIKRRINQENSKLEIIANKTVFYSTGLIKRNNRKITEIKHELKSKLGTGILKNYTKLDNIQKIVDLTNPNNVLKRGYSITKQAGKTITDIKSIEQEQMIETIMFNGVLTSIVKNKKARKE